MRRLFCLRFLLVLLAAVAGVVAAVAAFACVLVFVRTGEELQDVLRAVFGRLSGRPFHVLLVGGRHGAEVHEEAGDQPGVDACPGVVRFMGKEERRQESCADDHDRRPEDPRQKAVHRQGELAELWRLLRCPSG